MMDDPSRRGALTGPMQQQQAGACCEASPQKPGGALQRQLAVRRQRGGGLNGWNSGWAGCGKVC